MTNSKLALRETFVVAMPDKAPALGFDPMAETLSWQDVYPDNFWDKDNIKAKYAALGGWPVLTPKRIVVRPVANPEDEAKGHDPDLSPRLVLEFEEAGPALVLNKSRCQIAQAITGTPNPQRWAERLGKIVLMWGDYNDRLQLFFEAAPVEETAPATANSKTNGGGKTGNGKDGRKRTIGEINDDLFG